MEKKFLPMAYHPRMRKQLEEDGVIEKEAAVKVAAPKKTDPKFEEKTLRKKIIEEKPKKKVVVEYFKMKIGKKDEEEDDD